jgi:hypothetical protein
LSPHLARAARPTIAVERLPRAQAFEMNVMYQKVNISLKEVLSKAFTWHTI